MGHPAQLALRPDRRHRLGPDAAFGPCRGRSGTLTIQMETIDSVAIHNREVTERVIEENRRIKYGSGQFDSLADRAVSLVAELRRKGALHDRRKYERISRRFDQNYDK